MINLKPLKKMTGGKLAVIVISLATMIFALQRQQSTEIETKNNNAMNENTSVQNLNFSTTIAVDQSPEKVFNAINNVRGWWSEEIEGITDTLNEEFLYHYKDVHICKIKVVDLVPGKKVVWLVEENYFDFTKDKSEWKDTKISFEISRKNDKTQLHFVHVGLTPSYECFEICREAWSNYISESLYKLITTGKGQPNPKEGEGYNAQLVEKWKLK